MQLLVASQRAARQAAVQAIDAGLSARHASAVANVVAKYAGGRAALMQEGSQGQAAALLQLSAEETHEIARLVLEHAAEKRATRRAVLAPLAARQKSERQGLRRRNRRQKIVLAVQLEPSRFDRAKPVPRINISQRLVPSPKHRGK